MAAASLWKFPKNMVPNLKEAYLAEDWLYLVKQWNEYLIGETLCPVCPASVERVQEALKPIFLADVEVLHREGKQATQKDLVELFAKYVSPADPVTVNGIQYRHLKPVVIAFANADLKARGISERRRKKIFQQVFRISRETFLMRYCDGC